VIERLDRGGSVLNLGSGDENEDEAPASGGERSEADDG
jgi:hypothetical protein